MSLIGASAQARFASQAASFDGQTESLRHRDRVAGRGDRRIHQDRIGAELKRFGRV